MSDLPRRSANANRVAWRFARRTLARHRVRSILIAVMVAVPIIGLTGMSTYATSLIPTQQESLTTHLGQTQGRINVVVAPGLKLVQNPVAPNDYDYDYEADEATAGRAL